jgi:hypothetical protein
MLANLHISFSSSPFVSFSCTLPAYLFPSLFSVTLSSSFLYSRDVNRFPTLIILHPLSFLSLSPGNSEVKRPLGRSRCRWVHNIRMDLGENWMRWCGLDSSSLG